VKEDKNVVGTQEVSCYIVKAVTDNWSNSTRWATETTSVFYANILQVQWDYFVINFINIYVYMFRAWTSSKSLHHSLVRDFGPVESLCPAM